MTKKERFAKGFAALDAIGSDVHITMDLIMTRLREAGALELDVPSWEYNVSRSILEEYNQTSSYTIIPDYGSKASPPKEAE